MPLHRLDRLAMGLTDLRPSIALLLYGALWVVGTFCVSFVLGLYFAWIWWSAVHGWELMMRFLR